MTAWNKKMKRVIAKEHWRADQRHQRAIRGLSLADQSASWANRLWQAIQADLPWVPENTSPKEEMAWKPTKALRKATAGAKAKQLSTGSSCSTQGAWGGEHMSRENMKSLMEFYNHAYSGDMKACHITQDVARAFTSAKWANRCDEAATALLVASTNSLPEGTKVASVGGGPGSDACGFLVYNQLLEHPAQNVEVCVYDFSLSWQHIVEIVSKCNAVEPLGKVLFHQCDLQASSSNDVNRHIMNHVQTYDFWLFCYVIHESRACEHLLLGELLKVAKHGARFIILEACTPDLDLLINTASSVGEFEVQRIGGSEDAPFCGVCLTKTTLAEFGGNRVNQCAKDSRASEDVHAELYVNQLRHRLSMVRTYRTHRACT